MNRRNMMKGMSSLMVLTSFAMIASVVADQEGDVQTAAHWDAQKLGAGLALGLCGIGTGMSQGPIGARRRHDIRRLKQVR